MINVLKKNQLNEILGKYSYVDGKILISELKYISGSSTIDNLSINTSFDRKKSAFTFEKRQNGIAFYVIIGFSYANFSLLNDNIVYWSILKKDEIFETKKKSVLGRAIIGGILLGPVGAVVGGISGIGEKKTKISDVDNILTIGYSDSDFETELSFSYSNKSANKVYDFFNFSLPDKELK